MERQGDSFTQKQSTPAQTRVVVSWALAVLLALVGWTSNLAAGQDYQPSAVPSTDPEHFIDHTIITTPPPGGLGMDKEPLGNADGIIVIGGVGALATGANATDNRVNITINVGNNSVAGGASMADRGVVSNNTVNVKSGGVVGVQDPSGELRGTVMGGVSYNGTAENNTVNIVDGGIVYNLVYGGAVLANGTAVGNKVEISGDTSQVFGDVYGGGVGINGQALNNSVRISESSVGGSVFGGSAANGTANYSEVYISNGKIGVDVMGGSGGSVNYNNVTIIGGTVEHEVYGGRAEGYNGSDYNLSAATYNMVNITGGANTSDVYGGYIKAINSTILNGLVSYNTVTINNSGGYIGNSTTSGLVAGGLSDAAAVGLVEHNEVIFENGYAHNAAGGYSEGNSTNVEHNTITINGGTIGNSVTYPGSGLVAGGWATGKSTGNVTFNIVNVNGGIIAGNIVGGGVDANSLGNHISDNQVHFSRGEASTVSGGYASSNSTNDVLRNLVNITGGKIGGSVYGGAATLGRADSNNVTISHATDIYSVYGGFSQESSASGNKVTLHNVTIETNVFGGYTDNGALTNSNGNNSVFLTGDVEIGGNLIAANAPVLSGSPNTITFVTGKNVVNGTVSADYGNILIQDGVNTLKGTVLADKLTIDNGKNQLAYVNVKDIAINNGENVFSNGANAVNFTVAGGVNEFNGPVLADKLTIDNGKNQLAYVNVRDVTINKGENVFSNGASVGNFTVAGGVNEFKGTLFSIADQFILSGGANTFNGTAIAAESFNLTSGSHYFIGPNTVTTTSDVLAENSHIYLRSNSNTNFNNAFIVGHGSRLYTPNGPARLTVSGSRGLDVIGALDLSHKLTVQGNATFNDGSFLYVNFDGHNQGFLNVTQNLNLPIDGTLRIEPGNYTSFADFDPDQAIVTAGNQAFDDQGLGSVRSLLFALSTDDDQTSLYGDLKSFSKIVDELNDEGLTSFNNGDKNIISMIDVIDGSSSTNDAFLLSREIVQTMLLRAIELSIVRKDYSIIDRFVKQISGEAVRNVNTAILDVALKSQAVVFQRLDRIHSSFSAVPPAAGEVDTFNRVWVGGFGTWARQKNRDSNYGYDYNTGGFSLGYDRRLDGVPGLRVGVSTSFSFGKIDSKSGWSSVDVDTAGFGVYGSYQFNNGLFVDANFGYGHSENDVKSNVIGGSKTGNFDIDTWQIGARTGIALDFGNLKFTPTVGARYLTYEMDRWAERVHGAGALTLPNVFHKKRDHIFEIPILLKLNGTFEVGQTKIIPEARLGWTFAAKRPDSELTVGLNLPGLSGYRATVPGIKAPRGSLQAGAGVKIEVTDMVDVFVNYDLDAARGFVSHNAALGIGVNF
jgi:outer membrane autotransporter protein